MNQSTINEMKSLGDVGFLFLYDVRFDPHNRAHCNPLPDGRVEMRLHTEPGFSAGQLVYNDGEVHVVPLERVGRDDRFDYWEVVFSPLRPQIHYSFAFMRDGRRPHIYYHGRRGLTHAVETRFALDLDQYEPFNTPAWMKSAVIYQIFPERFANGDPTLTPTENVLSWDERPQSYKFQGGDLVGITQHLNYLEDLGINVLYLNPINDSPSNHKYDASDFYKVDPALGGDDALRDLVTGLHERDMRIMLDASFNHCHPTFFAFQDVVKNGERSVYKEWFTIYDFPVRIKLRPHKLDDPETPPHRRRNWQRMVNFEAAAGVPVEIVTDDGPLIEPTYLAWYGVITMPKINQNNPEARAYFLDVAAYWLREFDIDGWRMDVAQFVPDDFWQAFRDVCKSIKPDCMLLAEIWGDTAHWLQGDMFDATMNYLLRELCLEYFATGELTTAELKSGLLRLDALYATQVTAVQQNLLSSHDVARFVTLSGEDRRRFWLATFLQLTLPGTPSIYYGDEIGMVGEDDPDNRRPFPWHDRDSWDHDLRADFKALIALRRSNDAFTAGSWRWLWSDEDAFAFERWSAEQRVVVFINRGAPLRDIAMPVPDGRSARALWGDVAAEVQDGRLVIDEVPGGVALCWEIG